jgi:ribosomal protein L11 methylase PrmA
LNLFQDKKELFEKKNILDIGCNSGVLSLQIARNIELNHLFGIDIDPTLIEQANKEKEKIISNQQSELKIFLKVRKFVPCWQRCDQFIPKKCFF